MEFFVTVPVQVSSDLIKSYINLNKLSEWCDAINEVIDLEGNRAMLVCEMGKLHVHRELIQEGVRFSITDSPYALQWTVTADSDNEVIIHCTINTMYHMHTYFYIMMLIVMNICVHIYECPCVEYEQLQHRL